jgi:hypothetical protein
MDSVEDVSLRTCLPGTLGAHEPKLRVPRRHDFLRAAVIIAGAAMNIPRAGWVLVIVFAAALASEPVLARGKGGSGGGRSGQHSGAGRSAHHSGGHHHARSPTFAGGFAATPAFWPWWNYPAYQLAGAYPAAPLYYMEQGDEAAAPAGEWLYCQGTSAYFPYVLDCAGGWQRVAPQIPSG